MDLGDIPEYATARGSTVPRCGNSMVLSMKTGLLTPNLNGIPLSDLVGLVEQRVNRVVYDRTGLTGLFDIGLSFVDESLPPMPGTTRVESDAPRLFTALTEQLGLKLESSKGLVELLVIDSVQPPSAD
jgi:uncharacterized protein (TIGR03435 family)